MKVAPELDSLVLFVLLIVPGLISMFAYRFLMPARDIEWKTALVEALFYGVLNFGICLPIIIPIHQAGFPASHLTWYVILMVAVLVLLPLLWSCLLCCLFRWKRLMKRLQLPFPTAWDFFFHKRESCFILIHLKNGKMIGGYFGGDSYATSFPRHGDIYLQQVCKVDELGRFEKLVEDTKGLLISRDTCDYVEMFAVPGTGHTGGDDNGS